MALESGEWQFLQCFGERTPGEEVQDGASHGAQVQHAILP